MNPSPLDPTCSLIIHPGSTLQIEELCVEVVSYIGQFADIYYFRADLYPPNSEDTSSSKDASLKPVLLRVGSVDGGLNRELQLRQTLGGLKMVSELLASIASNLVQVSSDLSSPSLEKPNLIDSSESSIVDQYLTNPMLESEASPRSEELNLDNDINTQLITLSNSNNDASEAMMNPAEYANVQSTDSISQVETSSEVEKRGPAESTDANSLAANELNDDISEEGLRSRGNTIETITTSELKDENSEIENLEEEVYTSQRNISTLLESCLIFLSDLPEEESNLENWFKQSNSLEETVSVACKICQFFKYAYQQGWCFVQIFPNFIQVGTPVMFFDLTGVYPIGEKLASGWIGSHCVPEIAYDSHPINEQMSTYLVGSLLYQAIHQKPPLQEDDVTLEIKSIPRIKQLLSICLGPIRDRFQLSQLLNLLIETRQLVSTPKVQWQTSVRSTLGLSNERLQNEDSYGVRQQQANSIESFILAAVADGMGGMVQGEVASRLAIQTLMESPISDDFKEPKEQFEWLVNLVRKANESVADNVHEGGSTLSVVLAVGSNLMIAHIGDSRILLIRDKKILQLSEDHSMAAVLLASGQITLEESLKHPDRNTLIRSLGARRALSDDYIHNLNRLFGNVFIPLQDMDILILCSDGVWDLVTNDELIDIFSTDRDVQDSTLQVIDTVLERGAHDNATIVALQCSINTIY